MKFGFFVALCLLIAGTAAQAQSGQTNLEAEADTLFNQEDYAGASKLYSKIIESPNDAKPKSAILYKRSVCYYSLGKMDEALADVVGFLKENPESSQAHILKALIHKEKGEGDAQLAELNIAIKSQPDNLDLIKWRASISIEKSDFTSALNDLKSIRKKQDDAETEMFLGVAYYNAGKSDSALQSLNKSISLDVNQPGPYLYAASFCLEDEKYELGLKYAEVLLKVDPQNRTALYYKGIALVELKKEKEGCACLSKAFKAGEDEAGDYLKEHCYGVED